MDLSVRRFSMFCLFRFSKLSARSFLIVQAEEQETKERRTRVIEHELELVKGEREVHKECESLRRQIYNGRSEIIKSIPHFWLIAFLSHYALHHLLSEEDQKIFRYLNSVNVEETKDDEGVISGHTNTLNFDENPYFKNDSLEKTILHTIMRTDPLKEYIDGEVNIRVSDIHWKNGMDITTDNKREFSDTGTRFVADLIKHDFWPDAGRYFVNKVDFIGIDRTAQFTSSLRAFFI
ncbi:hypothetical protein MKX01_031228 [Papaver californicum]|nr:hypothetical protein MKX01_031228 [Papaver californicum]